jgi:hypothetical protein
MNTVRIFVAVMTSLGVSCLTLHAVDIGGAQVHGTVSQGYIYSSGNNYIQDSGDGTFDFREYGLNASITVGERVTVGSQAFGREYGTVGDDQLYLDWLVAEYVFRDWLVLRGGKLKVPYGLYGETRDIDSLRTEILLPQGVYIEYIRASYNAAWGGSLSGYTSLEGSGGFSYSLQGGVRDMDEDNGEIARVLSDRGMDVAAIDEDAAVAAAFTWHTPLDGLRAGATWSWGEFSVGGDAQSLLGQTTYNADVKDQVMAVGSVEYVRGDLSLVSECMYGSFDATYRYAPLASGQAVPPVETAWDYWGAYLKGDYRVADWLALSVGYSHFDFKEARDFGALAPSQTERTDQKDWFLSSRFDVSRNLILKVEQHFLSGTAGIFDSENPDGVDDDCSMSLVKATYVF